MVYQNKLSQILFDTMKFGEFKGVKMLLANSTQIEFS
jgi:hypothetical protein